MKIARSILFIVTLTTPLIAAGAPQEDHSRHTSQLSDTSSPLIQQVRQATAAFQNANQVPSTYGAVLGCVSGPDQGAMGVHFVNGGILFDGELKIDTPEALIYEFRNGVGRLVGVEYIVLFDDWHKTHAPNDPPTVGGQLLNLVEFPNRFGLPGAFYELHVWAWRDNPNGAFVDWNPAVSCEGQ